MVLPKSLGAAHGPHPRAEATPPVPTTMLNAIGPPMMAAVAAAAALQAGAGPLPSQATPWKLPIPSVTPPEQPDYEAPPSISEGDGGFCDGKGDLDVDATSDEEESDAEPVFAAPERSLEDPVDGAGPLLLKGVVETDDRLQRRHAQLVAQVTGRRAPPYGSQIPTAPRPPPRVDDMRVGRWVEVWWPGPGAWYLGRIVAEGAGTLKIAYTDGQTHDQKFQDHAFRGVGPPPAEMMGDAATWRFAKGPAAVRPARGARRGAHGGVGLGLSPCFHGTYAAVSGSASDWRAFDSKSYTLASKRPEPAGAAHGYQTVVVPVQRYQRKSKPGRQSQLYRQLHTCCCTLCTAPPRAMASMSDKVAALSAKLSGKKKKRGGGDANGAAKRSKSDDPSARYLANPLTAPIVQRWHAYFRSRLATPPRVFVGPKTGWRGVAKLAARRVNGRVLLGLFAPGTHDVVASASTSAAHAPALNTAIKAVEAALADEHIYANGAAEDGSVSYVGLAHESTTDRVQVVVVVNGDDAAPARRVRARLEGRAWLHSFVAHLNPVSRHDNASYGRGGPETWRPLPQGTCANFACTTGQCVREAPLGVGLFFAPACFRQANLAQFAEIVRAIQKAIPKNARVVELYGGVATIGAHLLERALSVRCSDENPWNAACVDLLKRGLDDALAELSYETAPAAVVARRGDLAPPIVVDPPRKGLSRTTRPSAARAEAGRLVYVLRPTRARPRGARRGPLAPRPRRGPSVSGADHVETAAVLDEGERRSFFVERALEFGFLQCRDPPILWPLRTLE